MAFRKTLAQRLLSSCRATEHSPISPPSLQNILPPNAAKTNLHREYITTPEAGKRGLRLLRRFLHRRAAGQALPDVFFFPVGEKLREKLEGVSRLRLDGLSPPAVEESFPQISIEDARKLLKLSYAEKLKAKLRQIPKPSIPYSEFVQICVEGCGNQEQGLEFANMLDQSGHVIVLGNTVFLRPEQVAKSLESVISESVVHQNDPRREELEQMEKQKALIDQKAKAQVNRELLCGLGYLTLQTLGFMRLTFWELSWDVMEPICFFVTSLHFAFGYAFFLRTSTEPSFEGYFQRRFRSKQEKLMKIHNFDIEKYTNLRRAIYPDCCHAFASLNRPSTYKRDGGALL